LFLGPRPDVEGILSALDVFVSSSLWEGLPTVVLESMAAGAPVVATAIAGTREIVVEGVSGMLGPPGDAASLAAAISGLLASPARRAELAAGGRERVREFSIERVAEGYLRLYRDASR
jgi:glycosyltransferase involved in cell wall biosynthesis